MKKILNKVGDRVKTLWVKEPARITTYTIAAVGFVLHLLNVATDVSTLTVVVGFVLPLIFGGEVVRKNVTPAALAGEGPGDPLHVPLAEITPLKVPFAPDQGDKGRV